MILITDHRLRTAVIAFVQVALQYRLRSIRVQMYETFRTPDAHLFESFPGLYGAAVFIVEENLSVK